MGHRGKEGQGRGPSRRASTSQRWACRGLVSEGKASRGIWRIRGQHEEKLHLSASEKSTLPFVRLPITSFEAKKWLEGNFPSRGKVINFPSSHKNSIFSNPSFHGKTGHFEGKRKIISRENFPSELKFTKFSLGGKILPQKMFRVHSGNHSKSTEKAPFSALSLARRFAPALSEVLLGHFSSPGLRYFFRWSPGL